MKKLILYVMLIFLLISAVSCNKSVIGNETTTNAVTTNTVTEEDTPFSSFSSYLSESHAIIIKWGEVLSSNEYKIDDFMPLFTEVSITVEQVVTSTFSDSTDKITDNTRIFVPTYCTAFIKPTSEALVFADIFNSKTLIPLNTEKKESTDKNGHVLVLLEPSPIEKEVPDQFIDNPELLPIFPIKDGKIIVNQIKYTGVSPEGLVVADAGYPKDKDGCELPLYVPIMQIIREFAFYSKIQTESFENGITVDEAVRFLDTAVNWNWKK